MRKTKLLQEPGFLQDLYFIFYLNFNSEQLSEDLFSKSENAQKVDFFKNVMLRFGKISDDLAVFFKTIGGEERTFIYDCYLKKFKKQFITEYNIEELQQELSDKNQLIKNMIDFYLKEMVSDDDTLADCYKSSNTLFASLKTSNYSMQEKLRLYEFFTNPTPYIKLLQHTIIEKQSILLNYYNEKYREILEMHDKVILTSLIQDTHGTQPSGNAEPQIYTSYCLIDKTHFDIITNNDFCLYLLGTEYDSSSNIQEQSCEETLLKNFCHALSEKNRVQILKLMFKEKEVTCKDLERAFNFSGSTAYHHLSIMLKSELVKTRNTGKSIFYSINQQRFNDFIRLLKHLSI